MLRTLERFRPRILVVELHHIANCDKVASFFERLAGFGYGIKWFVPRGLVDGLLAIPHQLLLQTAQVIQGHQLLHRNTCGIRAGTRLDDIAKIFLSSNEVYHAIFERVRDVGDA